MDFDGKIAEHEMLISSSRSGLGDKNTKNTVLYG